jgi:hypothetical protein
VATDRRWAAVYATDKVLVVETCSGLARVASDPAGKLHILAASASDEVAGAALRDALTASRVLAAEEVADFFDPTQVERRYEEWVRIILAGGWHATRRDLFSQMKHCPAIQVGEEIVLRPTDHDRREGWSGLGAATHVHVPSKANDAELGAALRTALERST